MIKICRSIQSSRAATSLLSISLFTDVWMCVCAINSTKIVFMMCLLRCIYDALHCILYFQYGCVCLVPYVVYNRKRRFSAALHLLLKCIWQWTSTCIDSANGMKHHPKRLLFILSAFYWDHFQNPAFHCLPFLFV